MYGVVMLLRGCYSYARAYFSRIHVMHIFHSLCFLFDYIIDRKQPRYESHAGI
jgi:hypothetical protein